jgi:hypothetical protein
MKKRGEFDMRFAKILSLVVFSLVIYQLIGIYNISAYETSFRYTATSASPINNSIIPFHFQFSGGNCYDNIFEYVSGGVSNTLVSNSFYTPASTLLGTSSLTITNNNCNFMGNFTGIINNDLIYRSRIYTTYTGSAINQTKKDKIVCDSGMILKLIDIGYYDSYTGASSCTMAATTRASTYINETINSLCNLNTFTIMPTSYSHSGTYCWTDSTFHPFNSGSGNVTINITEQGSSLNYYYFTYNNPSLTSIGAGINNLILTENTDYVFMTYRYTATAPSPVTIYRPTVIITVNTNLPNFICGEYGECINGTKQHLCHDSNNILPDKLEFEVCYSAPDKILNIGFEDSINANVFYSQPTWFCLLGVNEKNVEYPKDWNVNTVTNPMYNNSATSHIAYIFDNIKMTNEDSTNGIKSLKLWYLPPQQYLPQCNNETGTCPMNLNGSQCTITPYGNYSCGNAPQIERNINETWLVSKNLTFNYPNITLSFDARKCSSPEQEWSGNSSLFGVCGEGYYTNDKSSNWPISNTMIYYSIYDYNTSSMVYIGSGEVKTNLWDSFELLLINLDVTHLYQLQINLLLSSEMTSNVYCAMIDNVNINAYSGAVRCMSYCDDERTYRALVSQDQYGCSFTFTRMSPKCFDLSISPLISGCSPNICPICEVGQPDYLTLYSGDNSTGVCVWTFTENSDYCANYCSTQKLISDNPLAQDIAVYFQFFNPIWIITFIIMGIGAFLAYKIKDWHIFAIAVIVGFFISAVVWIEMAFIAICIMIVVAYFMFKDMSSK